MTNIVKDFYFATETDELHYSIYYFSFNCPTRETFPSTMTSPRNSLGTDTLVEFFITNSVSPLCQNFTGTSLRDEI